VGDLCEDINKPSGSIKGGVNLSNSWLIADFSRTLLHGDGYQYTK
jgi:hypothetical protein